MISLRAMRTRQRGSLLFDALLASVLLTILALAALQAAQRKAFTSDYTIAIEEARVLAAKAELYRQRVSASGAGANPNDPWQITYSDTDPDPAAYISAEDFLDLTGDGGGAAFATPWGSPYEIRANDDVATVRFHVTSEYQPDLKSAPAGGVITHNADGSAEVELQSLKVVPVFTNHRSLRLKSQVYREDIRS